MEEAQGKENQYIEPEVNYAPFGEYQGGPIPGAASVEQNWPSNRWGYDWIKEPPEGRAQFEEQEERVRDHRIRNIEYLKVLGVGGYGKVWKVSAEFRPTERSQVYTRHVFACKVTKMNGMSDLLILRYLRHTNVCNICDFIGIPDSEMGYPFSVALLLLELCDGSLNDLRKPTPKDSIQTGLKTFSENMSRHWFAQIARALEYIHSQGITHENLNEDNILYIKRCSEEDTFENIFMSSIFKLADFGVSKYNHIPEANLEKGKAYDLKSLYFILLKTGINRFAFDNKFFAKFLPFLETGEWTENYPRQWNTLSNDMIELMKWLQTDDPGITAETVLFHEWLQNNRDHRTEPFIKRYGQEDLSDTYLGEYLKTE